MKKTIRKVLTFVVILCMVLSLTSNLTSVNNVSAQDNTTIVSTDSTNSDTGDTTTTTDGSGSDATDKDTTENTEDNSSKEETTKEEDKQETTSQSNKKAAPRRAASTTTESSTNESNTLDLTQYLKSVDVQLEYSKDEYDTIDNLNAAGQTVSKGTGISVKLTFNNFTVEKKDGTIQTLTYTFPENLFKSSFSGKVTDANNSSVTIATYTVDENGKLTVTMNESYFESNKHDDTSMDLHGFNFQLWEELSNNRGQTHGGDDAVLKFSYESTATTGKYISYTIPFDYYDEYSPVTVTKTSSYDPATRTITYTIIASTAGNSEISKGVKVVDSFTGSDYLDNKYQNVKCTSGTSFDSGTWNIGDMKPNTVVNLEYTAKVKTAYFTTQGAEIKNLATATYNNDVTVTAEDKLQNAGTNHY
jgi:hypothetical protein